CRLRSVLLHEFTLSPNIRSHSDSGRELAAQPESSLQQPPSDRKKCGADEASSKTTMNTSQKMMISQDA
ncbi:hypothetical protein ANCDUO_19716, partial [Ancylostoma duodenale]